MDTSAPPPSRPALWNPSAAAFWSLLFTPVFGAFLHARNARALGRTNEARINLIWVGVYLVFIAVLLASVLIPAIPDLLFGLTYIALVIAWYLSVGHRQVAFVTATFGSDYERRSWILPLLLGLGGLVVFFVLFIGLALVSEALSTEPARA